MHSLAICSRVGRKQWQGYRWPTVAGVPVANSGRGTSGQQWQGYRWPTVAGVPVANSGRGTSGQQTFAEMPYYKKYYRVAGRHLSIDF